MPLFVEGDAAVDIAPDTGEVAIDLAQAAQLFSRNLAAALKGQAFERSENGPSFPHLPGLEWAYTEASPHVGVEDSFAGKTDKRFSHRGAADSQLSGQRDILYSATWR